MMQDAETGRADDREPTRPEQVLVALDRTRMASDHLQMALEDHPVLKADPTARRCYDAAVAALEGLYQRLGEIEPEDV